VWRTYSGGISTFMGGGGETLAIKLFFSWRLLHGGMGGRSKQGNMSQQNLQQPMAGGR